MCTSSSPPVCCGCDVRDVSHLNHEGAPVCFDAVLCANADQQLLKWLDTDQLGRDIAPNLGHDDDHCNLQTDIECDQRNPCECMSWP